MTLMKMQKRKATMQKTNNTTHRKYMKYLHFSLGMNTVQLTTTIINALNPISNP